MVQEADKIKHRIEMERGMLERDLHEIERRVHKAMSWREWFDRNPAGVLGAAAVGGFVLSMLIPRPSGTPVTPHLDESEPAAGAAAGRRQLLPSRQRSVRFNRMADVLDTTFAALLGVGSRKVREFIGGVVPNFEDEYHKAETDRAASPRLTGKLVSER